MPPRFVPFLLVEDLPVHTICTSGIVFPVHLLSVLSLSVSKLSSTQRTRTSIRSLDHDGAAATFQGALTRVASEIGSNGNE